MNNIQIAHTRAFSKISSKETPADFCSGVSRAEGAARGAAPLGIYTNFVDTKDLEIAYETLEKTAENRAFERRKKWGLLNAVSGLATASSHDFPKTQKRVSKCLRSLAFNSKGVDVCTFQHDTHTTANFGGVMQCGNVWTCPICTMNISSVRAEEANTALSWAREQKDAVIPMMVTLTARHGRNDSLIDLVAAMIEAKRSFFASYRWKSLKSKVVGFLVALEVTYGLQNGWHPHFHLVVFLRTSSEKQAERYLTPLKREWLSSLKLWNLAASGEHGFNVSGASQVGNYIAKFGAGTSIELENKKGKTKDDKWNLAAEITSSARKKGSSSGLTPWQLLEQYAFPDLDIVSGIKPARCAALFVEYAFAMERRQQLQWSRGFKKLVGLLDKTDEQLLEEEEERDALDARRRIHFRIHPVDWYRMLRITTFQERDSILQEAELMGDDESIIRAITSLLGYTPRRDADDDRKRQDRWEENSVERNIAFNKMQASHHAAVLEDPLDFPLQDRLDAEEWRDKKTG